MIKEKKEWEGKTGGKTFGQKAMKITFMFINVRFGYAVLAFVVPFYMIFNHKEYLAIYHYFRRRQRYSVIKSFFKTYQNHFIFGQAMLDRFAVYAGQKDFKVENPDNERYFLPMLDSPKGCIIASSHVGNPELCGYLLKQNKKRINSLIYGGEGHEVQKNRSKVFSDNNVRLIPVSEDMSHIFVINEALSNGEVVSILSDRIFGSDKNVECNFLNGKAHFPIGAFVLALQFDVPVLAMFVLKISTSLYRIHIRKINVPKNGTRREQIAEMTRSFAHELEEIVKQYPEQWFNFYEFWK